MGTTCLTLTLALEVRWSPGLGLKPLPASHWLAPQALRSGCLAPAGQAGGGGVETSVEVGILNSITYQALCTKCRAENHAAQSFHSAQEVRHMSKLKTSQPTPGPSFVPQERVSLQLHPHHWGGGVGEGAPPGGFRRKTLNKLTGIYFLNLNP